MANATIATPINPVIVVSDIPESLRGRVTRGGTKNTTKYLGARGEQGM